MLIVILILLFPYYSISIALVGDLSLVPALRLATCIKLVLDFKAIEQEVAKKRSDALAKMKIKDTDRSDESLNNLLQRTARMGGFGSKYEFCALSRVLKASINVLYPSPYGSADKNIPLNGGIFGKNLNDPSRTINLIFYSTAFHYYKKNNSQQSGVKMSDLYQANHFSPLLMVRDEYETPSGRQNNNPSADDGDLSDDGELSEAESYTSSYRNEREKRKKKKANSKLRDYLDSRENKNSCSSDSDSDTEPSGTNKKKALKKWIGVHNVFAKPEKIYNECKAEDRHVIENVPRG